VYNFVCRFARGTSVKEDEDKKLREEHFDKEEFKDESYYVLKKFIFCAIE
jgi:hypothetical protein